MARPKKTVAIICGGVSQEHEVSLQSAYYVFKNIDRRRYRVVLLGIDKDGYWHYASRYKDLALFRMPLSRMKKGLSKIVLTKEKNKAAVFDLSKNKVIDKIDIFFPLIHGPFGEDGCLQGYLELLGIPYVGAGVLGSALGMDKEYSKKILQAEKISVAPFIVLAKSDSPRERNKKIREMVAHYGFPLFVKPTSLGSSVGISKAANLKELKKAISLAFRYDYRILIEKYIKGREIECSVLGNDNPQASLPGEIRSSSKYGFYSYAAKYLDPQGAQLIAPAHLTQSQIKRIQALSIKVFKSLGLRGMARVDMFLQKNNKLVVNEVNTIPGFTQISMYPHLWEVSGLSYSKLLTRLIILSS